MGRTLYLMNSGELKRKGDTLCIVRESEKPKFLPVESTDEIMIFGEVDFNKSLLEFLTQKQVILHIFNYYGYYTGTYYPREHMNAGAVILAQARHCMDLPKRMEIASTFVTGAIENMKKVIEYYKRRRADLQVSDILEDLDGFAESAPKSDNVAALMGVEGNARNRYYQFFDRLSTNPAFQMDSRTRRPPTNRMNALISFLNSMCYLLALSQIYRTYLDPRIGFLHETNFRSFSLNLDIAEIFKPILVDRLIFSLINKQMIQEKHFEKQSGGGIYLNEKGREIVLRAWEERVKETIEHPRLKRKVSYRGLVRMEIHKVQKHILEDKKYIPYASRW
ncbi:MAG: type I-B CRISPR-associated endonuclease Cas1b [Synergistaceae bacterium]|nr:type I-B CRISPR-associated endonuclease Cas1b [Synergistaceae bacterium]